MKGSAAKLEEIHDSLKKGGYDFTGKDQMKNLRISLTKNSTTFAYLKGSDTFGLWDFYGGRPKGAVGSAGTKAALGDVSMPQMREDVYDDPADDLAE